MTFINMPIRTLVLGLALAFISSPGIAQKVVLERSIPVPTSNLLKGHTIQAVHTGMIDSTQVHVSLSTSFTKGQNDQSVESTRFYSRLSLSNNRCDTIKSINTLLFKIFGSEIYPAGMTTLRDRVAYFYTQFDKKKNKFSLHVFEVSLVDQKSKINIRTLFEAIVANPKQIDYRMTQSNNHIGLVFMQLEDKSNDRATLQWQIYDGSLEPVYQRSEKLNFGGGSVSLLDFNLSPELVCLTTLKHQNSKSEQDAIDYYVVSKERTSVYQGMALALRKKDASATWIRYNRDSATFDLGGLTAPSQKRLPEHVFHYRLPLQRVDLVRGGSFALPEDWVTTWKNDTREFAFRDYNIAQSQFKFIPRNSKALAVVYGAEGAYLGSPFQSDLFLLETSPSGIASSTRMERNAVVNKINTGMGYLHSKTLGAILISEGIQPDKASNTPNKTTGPKLLLLEPGNDFATQNLPLPNDQIGLYFYEGVQRIGDDRFVIPYRTQKGLSLAVYRINP